MQIVISLKCLDFRYQYVIPKSGDLIIRNHRLKGSLYKQHKVRSPHPYLLSKR